ncbi:uncharacterized protein MELLADRAFT_109804 [Melampsora larici-populina 98AG31]|uniref:Uncharacterized protein n=1 Tax=Melampsora larici-populina (strain 98AG31 / pathotype 3-4-7) TaxID=747676 RepID=F4RXP4_MELLP|nr:uncharacterized protein MELLADRAFT_109804 [Melampsora larici-populina 98AG31]EGG02763.1 hypothetical protein MELLADRAFT_109804 [Melampsora larici-populina 98AG31]
MEETVTKKCIAYTRLRTACPNPQEKDSKWCSLHEELQGKHMRIYKQHSRELDQYLIQNPYPFHKSEYKFNGQSYEPQKQITTRMIPRVEDVLKVSDIETLRSWHQISRRIWNLTNRTVIARERHHSQFYRDGDDGHRHFNAILRYKLEIVEALMSAIDEKIYKLTVAFEEANWVLDQPPELNCQDSDPLELDSDSGGQTLTDISSGDDTNSLDLVSTPSSSDESDLEPEFERMEVVEEKVNQRSRGLILQLTGYLDLPFHASKLEKHTVLELKQIVRNVFRRIIVRDAGLFVRAKEFDMNSSSNIASLSNDDQIDWRQSSYVCPVRAFIASGTLSLKELQRLFWKEKAGPELIRNAISDLFRSNESHSNSDSKEKIASTQKTSAKMWVLGGYVWKKPLSGPLPRLGTDYFYAFVGCHGCMLSTCRTFEEWVENRRLSLICSRYPDWLNQVESQVESLFRSLRIVISGHNSNSKLSRIERVIPKCKKLKTVYIEVQERHYVYLCLPLDSRSSKIIDTLASDRNSFHVFSSRRDTGEIAHKPIKETDLWCTRTRSAYSTLERKKKPFTISTMFQSNPNTFDCALRSLDRRFGREFVDCWDVLVMDVKVLEFQSFLSSIGETVIKAVGYDSVGDLDHLKNSLSGKLGEENLLGDGQLRNSDVRYLRTIFKNILQEDGKKL